MHGHGPLRPDDFGGGTETSVSLHREPRPLIAVYSCADRLQSKSFAKWIARAQRKFSTRLEER
jgi:hypothetical protein